MVEGILKISKDLSQMKYLLSLNWRTHTITR